MLHRRRLRDPEPVGRGLMGLPPWWDLSPAVTMRLHLLASLSGGGLAWRPGDRRWLAGEDQVWWHWGWHGPGGCQCLAYGVWRSWQVCLGGKVLGAGRLHGACPPNARSQLLSVR